MIKSFLKKLNLPNQTRNKMSESTKHNTLRNTEIKCRIGSDEEFQKKIEIAKNLTSNNGTILKQDDVFFNCNSGRLKLRYTEGSKAQLVQYDRPDTTGPKLSKFNKIEIEEPEILERMLTDSMGVKGCRVKKTRFLFIFNQTRIHLDKVENLGNFLEFEVCLKPEQTLKEGQEIAEDLMKTFQLRNEDLMSGAYLDELK